MPLDDRCIDNDRWDYYTTSNCPRHSYSFEMPNREERGHLFSGFCPLHEPSYCLSFAAFSRTLVKKLLLCSDRKEEEEGHFSVWCWVLPSRRETWWCALLNICSLDTSPHQQCGFQRHESDLSLPTHTPALRGIPDNNLLALHHVVLNIESTDLRQPVGYFNHNIRD